MPPVNAFRDGHTHAHAHTHTHTHTHTHAQTKAISENQACASLMAGLKIIVQIVLDRSLRLANTLQLVAIFSKLVWTRNLTIQKSSSMWYFLFCFTSMLCDVFNNCNGRSYKIGDMYDQYLHKSFPTLWSCGNIVWWTGMYMITWESRLIP